MKHLLTLTFLSIFGLTLAQVPSYVPTNGLVGWWPFNGNANDESGNGNNGTVNGATLTADRFGVTNKAFSFDGATNYIDCGPLSAIPNTVADITQSAWVYAPLDQTAYCKLPIMSKRQIITEGWPSIGAGANALNKAYYFLNAQDYSAGVSNIMYSNNLTNDGNWHLITGTKSGSTYKLYFDGVLQATQVDSYSLTASSNLIIGYEAMWGFNCERWYAGKLDDIGIWNRALTDCEIKDLYNSQLGSANSSSSTTQTAIDSYTWPVNNQTYTQSGVYTDTLVNAAGCDSIITLNLELDFTGIQTSNLTSLKLYPNPVQEVLHVEGLAGKEFEFEVLSVDGKLLQKGKSQGEISVKELRKGNYLLRVGQQQVSFVKI